MQKSKQESRQNFIIFEKPGILFEKLKTLQAPTAKELNISCWHSTHVFYLLISTKRCSVFFLFCLEIVILFRIAFFLFFFFFFL